MSAATYKYRAECDYDFPVFQYHLGELALKTKRGCCVLSVNSVEITIRTEVSLEEMIALAWELPDLHVIAQTIQPADKYTVERDFSREPGGTPKFPLPARAQ
jgi:hypothetical protein